MAIGLSFSSTHLQKIRSILLYLYYHIYIYI
jgi:hypothetical protein